MPSSDVDSIVKSCNLNGGETININEFLAATVDIKELLTDQMLWEIYEGFVEVD